MSMKLNLPDFERYFARLLQSDPTIGSAISHRLESATTAESAATAESAGGVAPDFMRETIVLTEGRPVLDVRKNAAVVEIDEPQSEIWKDRLTGVSTLLAPHIRAVGRIELANHPRGVDWLGTGWLLRDNIVVTNRHVADIFAEADGDGFLFRPGFDGAPMRAGVDFLEEFDNESSLEFPLFEVVHIERGGGPDVAFLRVEPVAGQAFPAPIEIAAGSLENREHVVVIGYPARDPFFPNPIVMDRIFNHRYDKKRIAPGLVTKVTSDRVFHDCTTLGGNSGGEVVSLKSGRAVALHFAGTLFTTNHAVPIDVVAQRLDDALRRSRTPREHRAGATPATALRVIEATIPIRVRVEIGDVSMGSLARRRDDVAPSGISPSPGDHDLIETAEARPEDYRDRNGYDPQFLGADFSVPLPLLTEHAGDILSFEFDGQTLDVLRYQHFSVQMSENRRLCRYSACNLNGKDSRRTSRPGWKRDPRIPEEAQILKECYGDVPKFSRGHMTRREDPAWGGADTANLGNRDSMHVTNAVPQMQPFNAGIWLDLEDYALDHARQDDMRISVFTGPFLANNDPIRFGVKIPIAFWKVIAFIHDETGELCATGYTMSQNSFIGDEEFVFGQHENHQRPIAEIEDRAGISFGQLAELDPLRDRPEGAATALLHPGQIRYRQ